MARCASFDAFGVENAGWSLPLLLSTMKSSWTLVLLFWSLRWRAMPLARAEHVSPQVGVDEERSFVPITRTVSSDEYDYNKHDNNNDPPRPTSPALEVLYPYFMDPNAAQAFELPTIDPGVQLEDAHRLPRGRLLDVRQSGTCVDPTYVYQCPQLSRPCCPVGYTVCCGNIGKCCQTGTYCTSTGCCRNGQVSCSDGGCCESGTTCCGEYCCRAGRTCCGGTTCCSSGYTCQNNLCVNPALSSLSTVSVLSLQSVASVSSLSANAASYSSSISRALASQTRPPGAATTSIATVVVKPNDSRIKYEPSTAWIGTSSSSPTGSTGQSPIGVCTNGTKVTREVGAKFSFIFEGTSIALFIISSSKGGAFSVQIDNEQPTTYSSAISGSIGSGGDGSGAVTITNSNGGVIVGGGLASILGLTNTETVAAATSSSSSSSNDQCIQSQVFSRDDLAAAPHQIVVVNGIGGVGTTAGVLEFSSIKYTGKGAFGTEQESSGGGGGRSSNNAAVIGGSIGGVLGAIALVAIGAVVMYRRKRRNSQVTTPATTTTGALGTPGRIHGGGALGLLGHGSPTMQQHQPLPSGPTTPYTIPSGNMQPTGLQQPYGYPYSGSGGGAAAGAAGGGVAAYYGHGRTMSNTSITNPSTSPPANVAPLPMWLERAARPGPTSEDASSSGEASPPPAPTTAGSAPGFAGVGAGSSGQQQQFAPNPFYGSHYPANASGANTGYM